jgi:photosystem II stability/assembly factor-like uncharacterized protein
MKKFLICLIIINFSLFLNTYSKKEPPKAEEKPDKMNSSVFSGLSFRALGPGVTSGRIADIAVNTDNHNEFFLAVASGGVWKTTNRGLNFEPVFENEASYSIGCVTIDPNNTNVIWVGSGENNSQRSVAWGDGVYKSIDGGKSWKNMGLKSSEHIGKIVIDPKNSSNIYVAAQGPLWGPGGDRGLYKSTDGGTTWEQSLKISENTGVTDVCIDPRNSDILYCASYQRRRHVWTLINGGPEAAIHQSTDAGKTWNKLSNGLPSGDIGRIGLAISPVNPDIIFAVIETRADKGGIFCSTNKGASWEKRNKWYSPSAQYYHEIFCDPLNSDIVYFVDTYTRISYDGGRTLSNLSNKFRHVDDHALWIDPSDTKHLLIGGDGGLYETFDRGNAWRYFSNLPVTQNYRVGIDNAEPFYNLYYGTQDNNTWGGPSRTTNSGGITNEDWYLVVGGDGYQARIDPTDPNIVYGQWQYGNLVRYDRKSGEVFYIQPQAQKDEMLRWNWDTPLIISNHSPTRLYIAANKVFKTDDRGNTWKAISGDLSQQIDRNQLEVMGKIWGPDAVAKNASTSLYGNIVALSESPMDENVILVGTDDGLIQISNDGGNNWSKVDKIAGIPETTYVSDIFASQFDSKTIYATFNNHKRADFKPYIVKSNDQGKSWKSISGNLPENGPIWTVYEDFKNPNLLFAGTEYGLFFTIDGGEKWIQLKSGLPTIAIRDMEIQKRENDLCLATFGRGLYILDNYSPLRDVTPEMLDKEIQVFPIKDALMFVEDDSRNKNDQGESFFRAKNPAYGATITYYMKESFKTKKQIRIDEEKKAEKDEKAIIYPKMESLIAEDKEEAPYLLCKITDLDGNTIRLLKAPSAPGINRLNWDLRFPDVSPVNENTDINKNSGFLVLPGKYKAQFAKSINGEISLIGEPVEFTCKLLNNSTISAPSREKLVEFQKKVAKLQNAMNGVSAVIEESRKEIELIRKTLMVSLNIKKEPIMKTTEILRKIDDLNIKMSGNRSIDSRNENRTPSLNDRLYYVLNGMITTNCEPTATQKDAYKLASEELLPIIDSLRIIVDIDITNLKSEIQKIGGPWVPGTIPNFKPE